MYEFNLKSTLVAAAVLWSAVSTSAVSPLSERKFSFSGVQDQEFSQHLKAQVSASTNIQCALQCERTDGCLSYTFSKGDKRCRLHAYMMAQDMTSTAVPGTKLFLRTKPEWLEKACTSNAQCTVADTECVGGQCFCSEGFFFSYSTYTCGVTWLESACTSDANCLAANTKCLDSKCVCSYGYYFSESTGLCIDSCFWPGKSFILYSNVDFSQPYNLLALEPLDTPVLLGLPDCQLLCKLNIFCRVVVYNYGQLIPIIGPTVLISCSYRYSNPLHYITTWDMSSDKTTYQRTCA